VARNDSNIGIRYRLINDIFHAVSSLRKNYYAYSDGPFCDSYAPQMGGLTAQDGEDFEYLTCTIM
jgi:hypothetical protein